MNKAELVEEIVGKVGLTKKEVGNVVDAVMDTITDVLASGEKVTLVGFGTFQVMTRQKRNGRNPQSGQIMEIPAKTVPKFVPGKALREMVG